MSTFGFGGTSTPSFGFGTSTTASRGGFGFGTPASSAGFGLGTNTSTTSSGLGFGGFSSTPSTGFGGFGGGFGSATSTTNTLSGASGQGSSFGFGSATTSAPSANFGFGSSFGAPTTSTGGSLFSGFGQTATSGTGFGASTFGTGGTGFGAGTGFGSTNTGFGSAGTGFGTSAFGTGGSAFGGTVTGFGATGGTGFGGASTGFGGTSTGFGTTNTGFGTTNTGFGATNTGFGTPSLFGSSFGTGTTPLFGTGLTQQQQPQQLQLNQATPDVPLLNAIFGVCVYGDERDAILARLNLIQAKWGVGKGYYAANMPPVEFTPENLFCRFKAICYNRIPNIENKDGHVILFLNLQYNYMRDNQSEFVNKLKAFFANPELTVIVKNLMATPDGKCQAVMYVQQKGSHPASTRRIPVTEIMTYLQNNRNQLATSLYVENFSPQVRPDRDQLQAYLDSTPPGIDSDMWKQAKERNPDPEKLIPVPVFGFTDLYWRKKCQENETKLHQDFLDKVAEDIAELQRRHAATIAKIADYQRRFIEFEHRVLKVLIKQEISRKMGLTLLPEEEALRDHFTALASKLNSKEFKGRHNQLLAQARSLKQEDETVGFDEDEENWCKWDPNAQVNMRQYLLLQQNGVAHLIATIKRDLEALKVMKDGLTSSSQTQKIDLF